MDANEGPGASKNGGAAKDGTEVKSRAQGQFRACLPRYTVYCIVEQKAARRQGETAPRRTLICPAEEILP